AVAPGLAADGARVVDATGCFVTPGFIDMHAHSDFTLLRVPSAESKLRQGVTTEVTGMCGFSRAPAPPGGGLLREWAEFLAPGLAWDWCPAGFRRVSVNGEPVLEDGRFHARPVGRILSPR
ncbi:MAG: amidohydrolase family protein, partial [Candidatus Rokuibacteriota bacterium]